MTITQLYYVLAVAENKNFTLAAEKCFVTQPTLSMQIQKLEDEFAEEMAELFNFHMNDDGRKGVLIAPPRTLGTIRMLHRICGKASTTWGFSPTPIAFLACWPIKML